MWNLIPITHAGILQFERAEQPLGLSAGRVDSGKPRPDTRGRRHKIIEITKTLKKSDKKYFPACLESRRRRATTFNPPLPAGMGRESATEVAFGAATARDWRWGRATAVHAANGDVLIQCVCMGLSAHLWRAQAARCGAHAHSQTRKAAPYLEQVSGPPA